MRRDRRARICAAFAALLACSRSEPEPPPSEEAAVVVPMHERSDVPPQTPSPTQEREPAQAAADPPLEPPPPPDPWVRGTVESGDSLSVILARIGLDGASARAVLAAMTPEMDPAKIRLGQSWAARLDEGGDLELFEYQRSKTETVVVEPDEQGAFVARTVQAQTELVVAEVSGTIESSLWNAVTDAGEDGSLVPLLVDVLASNIDFYTDTRKGDRFGVVVEKEMLDGEVLRYARVLAVEYAGGVGTLAGVWWAPPGAKSGGYFDREGNSLDRVLLKSPLKFTRVSSQFNPKRMHPVLHRVKGHFGTDYAAPEGTPIWAAADGRIVFRGPKGGAGNMVILSHDGGLKTLYMHLSRFEDGQKVGDRVSQKTVIGYVGQTGLATGPHLHFGLQRHGKYVDPEEIKSVPRPGVPKSHRAQFIRESRALFERLHARPSGESEDADTDADTDASVTEPSEETPSDSAPQ